MKKQISIITLLIALWLMLTATALAQGPYDSELRTVAGGGGESTGSTYTVRGTTGQTEAGSSSGTTFTVKSGFWPEAIYRSTATGSYLLEIDRFDDTNAAGAQLCDNATLNDCSLRGGISKANADAGNAYTIHIPSGTYTLTLSGMDEDTNATGDLDITNNLSIIGGGAANTIVNGNAIDRIFDVVTGITFTVESLTLRNGFVPNPGGHIAGGAINAMSGASTIRVISSTLRDNHLQGYGAAIRIGSASTLHMWNSAVISNSTTDTDGSGVMVGGTGYITNTTFSDNSGPGALELDGGATGQFSHLTIVNNNGSAFINWGTAHINNSIVADCFGADPVSEGYNIEQNGMTCNFTATGDLSNTDPALAPLADNGGDTQTHALYEGSPAIDAIPGGTNNCGTTIATDQRGITRPDGSACDIGAFEGSIERPNNPPAFASTPVTTVAEGMAYAYAIFATDTDAGDVLTITTLLKPTWLSLSTTISGTAVLSGTPAGGDVGSHAVGLLVTDSGGLTGTQPFTVTVLPNLLPDLSISALNLTPAIVCRGVETTIGFTESNSGTVDAGAHMISFFNDDTSSGYDNSIGSFPFNGTSVGANININVTYSPRTTGTRYIKVLADATGVITESNESNNGNFGVLEVIDDPAPAGTIEINDGATYTGSSNVSLALSATDTGSCATSVSQMRFAFNGQVTDWEPYATTKNLILNSLDGDKVTIYVQYKDEHSNASKFIGKSIILDDTPPSSTVTAPNGKTDSTSFTVLWSGTDNASGLKHFDIQYSDNDEDWVDWQTKATETSATFSNAEFGHSYCFRSRAEDNVGNIEAYPDDDSCINVQELIEGRDLTIERVEFTQAIQNQSNSIPLVANRPLLARVTVGLGTDTSPIEGVTARLHVFRDGQELSGSPLSPENGPVTAKVNPDVNSATDLLHFRFPTDWLVGTLQVYLEVDPNNTVNEMDEGNNRYPASDFETLTFNETYDLEVTIVPVIWNRDGQIMTVTPADIADLLGYVKRTYPLADVKFKVHSAHRYSGSSINWVTLLYQIKDIREMEQPRPTTYQKYYGLIPYPSDFSGGTVGLGFRPGTAAIGYAGQVIGGDETAAHEIGHNFGRKHVSSTDSGCGVPLHLDEEYPYINGILNYSGWDFGTDSIIPDTYHDYMSYCSDTWISDYTYQAIYDKIVVPPPARMLARQASTDGILVKGQISNDGSAGQLDSTFVLSDTEAIFDSRGGDFRVALVDSTDTEVYVYAFDPPELSVEDLNGVTSGFSYLLPAHSDITAVRLYYQNNLLDELTSATPPVVNITSVVPATLPTDEYILTWESVPADLTYFVRFSADNGATWTSLTPPMAATSYIIDVTTLAGTPAGLFEVVASSGLDSASVQSTPFAVGAKAPQTAIQGPEEGLLFAIGDTITLLGSGYDFEDGTLDNSQFTWLSDRDGELGHGPTLAISSLSAGSHTITLRVTDSNSQTGESQIQISIGASNFVFLPIVVKQ